MACQQNPHNSGQKKATLPKPFSRQRSQSSTSSSEEERDAEIIQTLVERLDLKPHPEGGYFSETWRGNAKVIVADPNIAKVRDLGTNIYYLLRRQDVSVWHRIKEAEIFYWHAGGTLKVHSFDEAGALKTVLLGDVLKNSACTYEAYMDPMTWMALEPTEDSPFVLIGDATFPGFEFEDWELGKASELKKLYPQHEDIIDRLSIPES